MSNADIQLIEVDPVTRRVSFGIRPATLSGISKLIQIVVLSLMNSPGRDVLDPSKGAGFPSLIGLGFDPSDDTELFAELARLVRKAEKEIAEDQLALQATSEERLREIQIMSMTRPEDQPDEVLIRLRVVNEVGRAADIVL